MFRDTAAPAEVRGDGDLSSSSQTSIPQAKINAKSRIQDEYFAAAAPDQIANTLMGKVDDWINYVNGTAHFDRIQKSYAMYYGWARSAPGTNSSQIVQAGPKGQYSLVFINEMRNTIKHVVNMITQQEIVFETHGANTDVATTESCELGNAILDQVVREKDVGKYLKRACEYGCFMSEGHLSLDWDSWAGTPYTTDEIGQPVFDGDISLSLYAPWNVVKDHWRRDEKLPWVILVDWVNKYDLAAKYPDKADAILACDPEALWKYQEQFYNQYLYTDSDLVPLMTFRHERSPALPNGRMVKFLDNSTKLFDGDLPYPSVSVYRIAPDHLAETPHGYTFAFDLLSVQDLQNLMDSITATVMKTYGVGVVKLPEGHNIRYEAIAEGLQALVINETNGQAAPMNFASLPNGIFDFRQWLSTRQDLIAGINSVIKGMPDSNIKAGNFAALIAGQAYQFSNALQESYIDASRAVGQGIIEMYQTFANTERVAKMAGINKEYMIKSFKKDDLKFISTVTVDVGNAATRTVAGRMQAAEDLLNSGKLDSAEAFLQVMETGKLEHVTEHKETEQNNIDRENENMRKGQMPMLLSTDNHIRHVHKHLCLLDDPMVRASQPNVVQVVTDHVMAHIQQWQQLSATNPSLLQMMDLPPAQLPPPPPAPPGAPMNIGGAPQGPKLPSLPNNPITQEPPPVEPPNVNPPPQPMTA